MYIKCLIAFLTWVLEHSGKASDIYKIQSKNEHDIKKFTEVFWSYIFVVSTKYLHMTFPLGILVLSSLHNTCNKNSNTTTVVTEEKRLDSKFIPLLCIPLFKWRRLSFLSAPRKIKRKWVGNSSINNVVKLFY